MVGCYNQREPSVQETEFILSYMRGDTSSFFERQLTYLEEKTKAPPPVGGDSSRAKRVNAKDWLSHFGCQETIEQSSANKNSATEKLTFELGEVRLRLKKLGKEISLIKSEDRQLYFNCFTKKLNCAEIANYDAIEGFFWLNPYYNFLADLLKAEVCLEQKTQVHHVIPRFEGGSNEKNNLLKLSISQHICAHLLRFFVWGDRRDFGGAFLLINSCKNNDSLVQAEFLFYKEISTYTVRLLRFFLERAANNFEDLP